MEYRPKDQALIDGIAANDSKSLEKLYKSYFPAIQNLILNNNGTYDDARDIFQEAVIALYDKVKDGNFVLTSQLQTYIYSVCKRLWLKKLNNKKTTSLQDNDAEEYDWEATDEDVERSEQKNAAFEVMERTLQSMGNPCKGILEAFYIQKKDMTEIAQMFGYTNPENAKNQKYKCLMRLKKLFFAQYDK